MIIHADKGSVTLESPHINDYTTINPNDHRRTDRGNQGAGKREKVLNEAQALHIPILMARLDFVDKG